MQREVFVALVVVGLAGSGSYVHAQGAASAEADALFDRGRELMDKKQYAEACNAFAASQKIAPATSTILNEADCREKNKQLATAYGLFRDAERGTRAPLDEATQKRAVVERSRRRRAPRQRMARPRRRSRSAPSPVPWSSTRRRPA